MVIGLARCGDYGVSTSWRQWAATHQREFHKQHRAIAAGLCAQASIEAVTVPPTLLIGLFLPRVVHAAGPGHGKSFIRGYGAANAVPIAPPVGDALLSSLGQAVTAVALVYDRVSLLAIRARTYDFGDRGDYGARSAYGAIACVGLCCSGVAAPFRATMLAGHRVTMTTLIDQMASAPPAATRHGRRQNRCKSDTLRERLLLNSPLSRFRPAPARGLY